MPKLNEYMHTQKQINNLDSKDKKIIISLNRNASLSFSDISKETNIPRHVISNRIKKLEQSKIVKSYKLNVNYKLLGFEEFEIHLRLMGTDKPKTKEIIEDLQKEPHISWIGTCFGIYDLKINIFAKSNSELYFIIQKVLMKHKDYVKAQEISSITKKYKTNKTIFLRSLLEDNKLTVKEENKIEKIKEKSEKQHIDLDELDLEIIKQLGQNPRMTISELSKKTKLSIQGTKNRIISLYKRKIILGSSALINGQALGYTWATCLFKINLTESQEKLLEDHLYTLPNTSSAVRLIGKWDLGITFFDKNINALQDRINEFKGLFKDSIKEYDSFIILEIYKYPELPECLFEK